ncbi:MAG: GIY-YIG nuclease family protein [Halobacteriota archaeon]
MRRGTYALVLRVADSISIEVGALGERTFEAGTYVYLGSAHGPGGFGRIERHRAVATGERDVRHWHIDYLLPNADIERVIVWPGADRECEVAGAIPGTPITGFGASDCSCSSHLPGLSSMANAISWLRATGGQEWA